MAPNSKYFKIGKLAASFGVKGQLILQHNLGKKTAFKGLTKIFVEENSDNLMPWFVATASIKNEQENYLQLEGIDNMEAARKLTPKSVWLTEDDFKKYASKSAPISLLGFTLYNHGKAIGEIVEVTEMPHQLLCTVLVGSNEALIPVHEDFVEKIDPAKRQLRLQLPDGLLEVYQ
jgi:16S rRNA processing protein RimM